MNDQPTFTEETGDSVLLGTAEYAEGKRIQALLDERGIQVTLASNPESCKKGCKITVEVFAREKDLPAIREVLEAEKSRVFDGLEFDPELANEVYDPERGTARCPACGTQFSTVSKECPDCGLVFGID